MKNRKAHILSFILIILMIIFTVATSKSKNFETIYNKITYAFENEYLVIKIETKYDPNYYIIENNGIQVNFEGMNKYQMFLNELNDDGENLSRYVIVDYPNESEIIKYGDYVFETFADNKYFIIKIKKELLLYNNVKILYIDLFNKSINKKEQYWNR
jgi:hypothetical protein